MTSSDDLAEEQAHIDCAHAELARMRARAEGLLRTMAGADPDLEWALARRVKALAESPRALCFGRIDAAAGESFHIGRRHVEDDMGDPVVVEWRAPVAEPFYRAGWADPMGLVRRRQFVVDGRTLLSIGDDDFGARRDDGSGVLAGRRGGDALLAELERSRRGEMVDIVATIQPEQDEVIRAPAAGVMAVQGGPGSGKTAVGLHRAAFLLYGDDAMARANVLVVGPSRTFLRYIGQVLPSLGESAVVQTTLTDLVPEVGAAAAREASPAAERVKGDARMATVLARALAASRSPSDDDLVVELGVRRLTVPAAEVDEVTALIASRDMPYVSGREVLRERMVGLVTGRYEELLPRAGDIRRSPGLRDALDARWPSVPPEQLLADVLSKPALLAAAAAGVLSSQEQAAIRRRRGRAWTVADAALLDEVKALVAGQLRSYGHAIVDEAQDLSPMQLRMLARRVPSGSMTLLGDLAQSVGVWGLTSWESAGEHLPTAAGLRVVELRIGYRSPAQVLELASRLLPEAAPGVAPTVAVRAGRSEPRFVPRSDDAGVVEEVRAVGAEWPTVAVVAPGAMVARLVGALRVAPGLPAVGEASADGLAQPITVVAADGVKGLEFDAVVVVEPAVIVAERTDRSAGLRLLYVALTRATQHLSVLHSGDPVVPTP